MKTGAAADALSVLAELLDGQSAALDALDAHSRSRQDGCTGAEMGRYVATTAELKGAIVESCRRTKALTDWLNSARPGAR